MHDALHCVLTTIAASGAHLYFGIDHLPSSSPSGKTVLIIFGCLGGFFAMLVLAVEFRATLGF
jgi:hypothetical protein